MSRLIASVDLEPTPTRYTFTSGREVVLDGSSQEGEDPALVHNDRDSGFQLHQWLIV